MNQTLITCEWWASSWALPGVSPICLLCSTTFHLGIAISHTQSQSHTSEVRVIKINALMGTQVCHTTELGVPKRHLGLPPCRGRELCYNKEKRGSVKHKLPTMLPLWVSYPVRETCQTAWGLWGLDNGALCVRDSGLRRLEEQDSARSPHQRWSCRSTLWGLQEQSARGVITHH